MNGLLDAYVVICLYVVIWMMNVDVNSRIRIVCRIEIRLHHEYVRYTGYDLGYDQSKLSYPSWTHIFGE